MTDARSDSLVASPHLATGGKVDKFDQRHSVDLPAIS